MVHDRANELRQLLNEWDFLGVFDPDTNTDEYDCMIEPLMRRMSAGADPSDIDQFLNGEITGHFGMSAGLVETASMAERLSLWWNNDRAVATQAMPAIRPHRGLLAPVGIRVQHRVSG